MAGMLYAPKSGSETRGLLRSKSDEATKYAKQAVSEAAAVAKQKTEELKESVEVGKQGVKAQMEALNSAVDAGKKTYEEASKGTPAEPAT